MKVWVLVRNKSWKRGVDEPDGEKEATEEESPRAGVKDDLEEEGVGKQQEVEEIVDGVIEGTLHITHRNSSIPATPWRKNTWKYKRKGILQRKWERVPGWQTTKQTQLKKVIT